MVAAAATVAVCGYFLCRRRFSRTVSLPVALIKAAIPLVFFARFYDGSWYFLDDFVYAQQGKTVIDAGFNPFSALFTKSGLTLLHYVSDGNHFLYGWWNVLGEWTFGESYWAAVFLNVILTYIVALTTARMLEDLDFPPSYVRGVCLVFMLHIEVIVWSSFVNLKDLLILTLTAMLLRSIIVLAKTSVQRASWLDRVRLHTQARHIMIFAALAVASYFIRFYVPFLLLAAFGAWATFYLSPMWRAGIFFAAAALGLFIMRVYAWELQTVQLSALPFGLVRFPLTPRPWAIDANYSFLFLPSIVQWVLFVPAVAAGVSLWMTRRLARLPLIYLLFVMLLFAASPELMGPRHRIQVLPLIVWLQFHAIWWPVSVTSSPDAADLHTSPEYP